MDETTLKLDASNLIKPCQNLNFAVIQDWIEGDLEGDETKKWYQENFNPGNVHKILSPEHYYSIRYCLSVRYLELIRNSLGDSDGKIISEILNCWKEKEKLISERHNIIL